MKKLAEVWKRRAHPWGRSAYERAYCPETGGAFLGKFWGSRCKI
jgi:hypothetical protein